MSSQHVLMNEISPGAVYTGLGDRIQSLADGAEIYVAYQYITSHPGQLSMASLRG